ncbi:poly [ADP-ribose] polymerase 1-like [Saccoglossus kowalevskii]|uniref:Poly [ADP-ribose] polymerase n=1 Tax=Saccoglossus kowalevskii TaxID=10224 RepID=A0ABM0LX92_SACKO|nr:PREDICTED: poly [ADP-ribose] polymerase 1-like [Saccoglossus kowalevskii]
MADEHHDYPFKAEYAKSSRASCKFCKGSISKESLRLAKMVQSPHFDGKMPNWFHYSCFWKRNKATSHGEFGGLETLRWDDQQKIKDKIAGKDSGATKGEGDGDDTGSLGDEFSLGYAKSNRSVCRGCNEKIMKDTFRIARILMETQRGIHMAVEKWHHLDCFCEKLDELGWTEGCSPEDIPGFKVLKDEDKKELLAKLKTDKKNVKRKTTETDGTAKTKKPKTKKETKEEEALRVQSQFIWGIRDQLYKHVPNSDLKELLEENNQNIPSGESKLLEYATDGMAFGALLPCPECKEGQLVVGSSGYRCTGNITSWTKCQYKTKEPKRKKWKIPESLNDIDYLKKFKFKAFNKGVRVFEDKPEISSPPSAAASASTSSSRSALQDCKIVLVGKLSESNKDITKKIKQLGGEVVTKINKNVACVISTQDEVNNMSKKIKEAKAAGVHVVSEDFLNTVKKGGAALMIQQSSIANWGTDPVTRISVGSTAVDSAIKSGALKSGVSAREEKMYTKKVPDKLKMTVKGGAAVDPDSGLEDEAHVYSAKGSVYNAILGLVDVTKGTNSYYKLQLLEHDNTKKWYVFRAWGRVGTTIGGNKVEKFHSLLNAMDHFCSLYGEKTGNDFGTKDFQKYPNKFYPLEMDYGQEEEELKKMNMEVGSNSKLHKSIQELIKMIFDIDEMKKTMLEFEIDLKKMPLGKLSKRQIESAYSVLSELQKLLDEDKATDSAILDCSNRFYTLIPHDFGMKKPPMLDNIDIIKNKTQMLDNLLDIEVAYSLLKGGDSGKDPIDANFEKLKCGIEVLEHKSDEFTMIEKYMKNTHAATHTQYSLELLDVYQLDRAGECSKYKPFKQLHNRQLLWHGSRTSNYAGILSQGLRIAPPEAPVTGYMFGKGVYFADMSSKSANYCRTTPSNNIGLMLLCEVALGNMYELTNAKSLSKPPSGKHSTKGLGATGPDPTAAITTKDGVTVPLGKGAIDGSLKTSLLYNEYIVYDVAQVQMKYLCKAKFNYKIY